MRKISHSSFNRWKIIDIECDCAVSTFIRSYNNSLGRLVNCNFSRTVCAKLRVANFSGSRVYFNFSLSRPTRWNDIFPNRRRAMNPAVFPFFAPARVINSRTYRSHNRVTCHEMKPNIQLTVRLSIFFFSIGRKYRLCVSSRLFSRRGVKRRYINSTHSRKQRLTLWCLTTHADRLFSFLFFINGTCVSSCNVCA